MATAVTAWASSQSRSSRSSAVVVPKVRTSCPCPPPAPGARTHAVTLFLCTSSPQLRSTMRSIAALLWPCCRPEEGPHHDFARRARWQQFRVPAPPASVSASDSRTTDTRRRPSGSAPFSSPRADFVHARFCVQAKRQVASRGSLEWPGGTRLSVVHGGSTPPPPPADYAGTSTEEWSEDEGDDGHQLDEDVHARPRGVLERIPHRVPDYGGLVRLQPLAAEVARLDVLLRDVPRASRVGHEECEENAHQRRAGEEAAQRFLAEHEAHEGRHHHRGQTWHDHLLERGARGDVHAASGVGLRRAL